MCVSTHSFFAGFVLPSPLNFNLKSCKRAHMTRVLMIVASNQEIVLGNADNLRKLWTGEWDSVSSKFSSKRLQIADGDSFQR